jgi:hypothetical protein
MAMVCRGVIPTALKTQVVHAFPGVQHDGVQHAESGHDRQQHRQRADQAEHQ